MNFSKFFNIIFSKPQSDTHDFLNRTGYKNITDPLLRTTIIVFVLFIVFIITTFLLTKISILVSFPRWTFSLSLAPILMIFYPRKCKICGNYMVKVFLEAKTNSSNRSMYYCCDNCHVKTKTILSEGGNIVE